MKRNSIFFVFLLFSMMCFSQVSKLPDAKQKAFNTEQAMICGGWDSIFNKKGKWKKTKDNTVFPDKTFPPNQFKYINNRVDSMAGFLKEAITDLSAVEAGWNRSIRGDSYITNGPVPYSLDCAFFPYYCNTNVNKILLADETSNWIYVFINTLNWFLSDAGVWDINNDGVLKTVYQLPPKSGKWKNYEVYEPPYFLGDVSHSITYSVVIGRNGKLPWRSLTQRQYLAGLKNDYEKQMNKLKEGTGFHNDLLMKLSYIKDYLAATKEETLEKAAIIDPKAGIWGFKGKFGNEDERGFRLVLLTANRKYFDTNLPRHAPQLVQVFWKYTATDTVALRIIKQLKENFPLEKLKAMVQ